MALAGVADEYTRYKMKKLEYFHCTNPSHNWIEWESVSFPRKHLEVSESCCTFVVAI